MKPPICAFCYTRFGPDEGGLVYFRKTPSDEEWYVKASTPGFVGHPPNCGWFCGAHVGKARELSEGTLGEALAAMKKDEDRA